MVSDIHLGLVVNNRRLEQMVSKINELNPDIVFLVGDTIDEDVELFVSQKMPDILKKLRSKNGVYAVLGNHEYISRSSELAVEALKQADVNVLVDEYVKVNDQFYVVGRDDLMAGNISGKPRMKFVRTYGWDRQKSSYYFARPSAK
jgi:predicted MPP superfamily phosphohydrolase